MFCVKVTIQTAQQQGLASVDFSRNTIRYYTFQKVDIGADQTALMRWLICAFDRDEAHMIQRISTKTSLLNRQVSQ